VKKRLSDKAELRGLLLQEEGTIERADDTDGEEEEPQAVCFGPLNRLKAAN
jgi:hypothetical protein